MSQDLLRVFQEIPCGTPLNIDMDDVSVPVTSVLAGMNKCLFVAITPPEPYAMIKHKLFSGNPMVIRFVHEGAVLAAQTKVMDVITKPIKLVFLDYPQKVVSRDLRQQKRINCYIPARIIIRSHRQDGLIQDITEGGCRFVVKTDRALNRVQNIPQPQKGDEAALTIQFPGINGVHVAIGTVMNITKKKSYVYFGIRFTRVEDNIKALIDQFTLSLANFS